MSSQAIMVRLTSIADAMGNRAGYAKHCERVQRFVLSNKAAKMFVSKQAPRFFNTEDVD